MRKSQPVLTAVLAAAALGLGGCYSIIDSAINSAADSAGNRIGEQIGNEIARQYTPQFMQFYTNYIFALAFGAGGYDVAQKDYAPGEWARFNLASDKDGSWMERAYLGTDADGNQWWKVKYFDGESGDTVIMEALLSADRTQMLRLRAKWPDDQAPKEMAVQQGTTWVPPQKLTPQSIEGATVGTGSVTVPAGTFTARHVRFGQPGEGTYEWWLVDSVPGGLVKSAQTSPTSDSEQGMNSDNWTLVLAAFGKDAKDELGAM